MRKYLRTTVRSIRRRRDQRLLFANRSVDGGVTWLELAADGDQVFALWTETTFGLTPSRVRFNDSRDGGATWQALTLPVGLSVPNYGVMERTSLCVTENAVYAGWMQRESVSPPAPVYDGYPFFGLVAGYQQYGVETPGPSGVGSVPAAILVGIGPNAEVDLAFPGGTLLVAPQAFLPVSLDPAGQGARPLTIPNNPSLRQLKAAFQAVVLDGLGLALSSGVALRIG